MCLALAACARRGCQCARAHQVMSTGRHSPRGAKWAGPGAGRALRRALLGQASICGAAVRTGARAAPRAGLGGLLRHGQSLPPQEMALMPPAPAHRTLFASEAHQGAKAVPWRAWSAEERHSAPLSEPASCPPVHDPGWKPGCWRSADWLAAALAMFATSSKTAGATGRKQVHASRFQHAWFAQMAQLAPPPTAGAPKRVRFAPTVPRESETRALGSKPEQAPAAGQVPGRGCDLPSRASGRLPDLLLAAAWVSMSPDAPSDAAEAQDAMADALEVVASRSYRVALAPRFSGADERGPGTRRARKRSRPASRTKLGARSANPSEWPASNADELETPPRLRGGL